MKTLNNLMNILLYINVNLYIGRKKESEVTQSCPTLGNLAGSSVHGIFQAGILEWVAIS